MAGRKEFLAALSEDTAGQFNLLMQKHYNNDDPFSIAETLETLQKEQISSMWKNLFRFCTIALKDSNFEEDEEKEQEVLAEALETLKNLTTIALLHVSIEKPIITPEIIQIVTVLHGILLSLPEDAANLQNEISKLCEYWFTSGLSGKEELVSNTIIYLLARTHLHSPTKTDLKRLWNIAEAFQLFDLEDESAGGLRELMQRCLMQALYLETKLGRKILVYMFTLHPSVTDAFHRNIKNQITNCNLVFLDSLSEIYFEAWKDSIGEGREKIESNCIQDLMHCAVHAKKAIFSRLESILSYFHKQKCQAGVDEMLHRLYQPILWRAVKAANPQVRANAASILIDAFPLQDPSAGVAENDDLKQMQLDVIAELLQDRVPGVRAIAVQGVCKICFRFWEFLPVATIKAYCTKLIEDLAFDISSSEVRVAVFKGLKLLINNRLSHSLLKNLLPNLRDLIHDNSERVRRAFLDFLLAVKSVRTIKFWSIVPLQHLLARLEVETSTNCIKLLVKLLINSYFQSKGNQNVKLENCLELMRSSRAAARTFFKFAHFSTSIRDIASFIVLLCQCALQCAGKEPQQLQKENEAVNRERASSVESGDEESDEEERETTGDEDIDFTDSNLITCLLEVLTIAWMSIKRKFDKGNHSKLKEKLVSVLSSAIPDLLNGFEPPEAKAAIIVLAANLPSSSTPMISDLCLAALQKLPPDSTSDQFGPVVQYLCANGFCPDVLDHLCGLFQKGLNQAPKFRKKTRKLLPITFNATLLTDINESDDDSLQVSQKKSNSGNEAPQSERLAVDMLSWILEQSSTRDTILEHKENCERLYDTLKSSMKSIEQLFKGNEESSKLNITKERQDYLTQCLSLCCRLRIHLQGKRENLFDEGIGLVEEILSVIAWMDRILLPEIDKYGGTSLEKAAANLIEAAKRNKRPYPSNEQNVGAFILQLIKGQLELVSQAIILGMGSAILNHNVADFIERLSSHASAIYVVPDMMHISRDITQCRTLNKDQGTDDADPAVIIIKACFRNVQLYKTYSTGEVSTQVLSTMKRNFTEILKTYFCSQAVFSSSDVSIMKDILSVIVDDITNHLNENEELPKYDGINDMPVIASFILTIITKSKQLQRALFEEMLFLATEEQLQDKWKASAVVFLIEVTMRTGAESRSDILQRTIQELKQLQEKVTFSSIATELLSVLARKTTEINN